MKVATLVVEDGGEEMPERELRPKGFCEVEDGSGSLKEAF